MNYIYDILLNFQNELYDFYDWNTSDNIIHIRKIPILKISDKDMLNIKNNKIKFGDKILNLIMNRTEIFTQRNIKSLKYSVILSSNQSCIGVFIKDNKVLKSKLLIDEEEEVLDICKRQEVKEIDYEIIDKEKMNELKTRDMLEKEKYIKTEINNLIRDENYDKLNYIYFDCFNERESDENKMVSVLKNKFNDIKYIDKIYDFLKMVQFNK